MRTMNMIVAMLKNGPSAPATALAVSGSRGSEAASCVTRLDAVATAARASSDSAAAASGANKAAGEDCVMRCGGGVEGQRANPNTGSAGWSSFDRRRRRIVNVQGCADGRGRTATAASAALCDLADAHAGGAHRAGRARAPTPRRGATGARTPRVFASAMGCAVVLGSARRPANTWTSHPVRQMRIRENGRFDFRRPSGQSNTKP